jgi:hypothetical protein
MSDEQAVAAAELGPEPGPSRSGLDRLWVRAEQRVTVTFFAYAVPDSEVMPVFFEVELEATDAADLTVKQRVRAVFSVPNQRQWDRYVRVAGEWDRASESILTDRGVLLRQLWLYHLLELDDPETGAPIALEWEEDKRGRRLAVAVERRLDGLHPWLFAAIMARYVQYAGLAKLL